jgi:hypothetical protein
MVEVQERRVSGLARRIGLELRRVSESANAGLYQLVEPEAAVLVFPGAGAEGASLRELEDWLGLPWE